MAIVHSLSFDEILEVVDRLADDDQQALLEIVRRRQADRRRAVVIDDISESRREFAAGLCRTGTVDALMAEILA